MTIEIDDQTKQLLQKFGFTEVEKNNFCVVGDDNIEAHVDFRKENGRRWARKANREFIKAKDIDTVPILKQFKEERDKILQSSSVEMQTQPASTTPGKPKLNTPDTSRSSGIGVEVTKSDPGACDTSKSSGDVEPETVLKEQSFHTPPDVKCVPAPNSPNNEIFEFIKRLTGNSILEVSGRSGVGKTKLLLALANISITSKKRILFIDSEQNLDDTDISRLGNGYVFLPSLKEIADYVQKGSIPAGTDMVFLDSLGAEQNGMWGVWDDTKRNKCLAEMASVAYLLKMWAIKNKKIVIITNQPKSDRGKSEKDKKKEQKDGVFVPNESVGDKHAHIIKTALYMQNILMNEVPPTGGIAVTRSWVKVLKGRKIGRGKELFLIDISDKGTTLHAFDKENLYKYFLESTD